MADDDATPLQKAVRSAIEAGGRARDHYDRQLQERLGTRGKPLYDIERGKSRSPSVETRRAMAEVFGLPPEHFVRLDNGAGHRGKPSDHPSPRTVDAGETAPVLRLDLSYSMGPGTDLDDSYVEGEAFQFDLGFLRSLTITPPERLRIVDGIGTSMEPTLHDRDLLLVDINQRDLNAQDRVWACWIFGLGAVKRLRAIGTDKILVISDNPDVENQEVRRQDVMIHGRVVGSIKRH